MWPHDDGSAGEENFFDKVQHTGVAYLPGPAGRLQALRAAGKPITAASLGLLDAQYGGMAGVSGSGCRGPFGASGLHTRGEVDPDFQSSAWLQALANFDAPTFEAAAPLLQRNSVSVALQRPWQKISKLLVLVCSVSPSPTADAFAQVKDPTGAMGAALHRSVMHDVGACICPMAVLLLQEVTVVAPSPGLCYLCITPDNIMQVFPPSEPLGRATPAFGLPRPGQAPPTAGRLPRPADTPHSAAALQQQQHVPIHVGPMHSPSPSIASQQQPPPLQQRQQQQLGAAQIQAGAGLARQLRQHQGWPPSQLPSQAVDARTQQQPVPATQLPHAFAAFEGGGFAPRAANPAAAAAGPAQRHHAPDANTVPAPNMQCGDATALGRGHAFGGVSAFNQFTGAPAVHPPPPARQQHHHQLASRPGIALQPALSSGSNALGGGSGGLLGICDNGDDDDVDLDDLDSAAFERSAHAGGWPGITAAATAPYAPIGGRTAVPGATAASVPNDSAGCRAAGSSGGLSWSTGGPHGHHAAAAAAVAAARLTGGEPASQQPATAPGQQRRCEAGGSLSGLESEEGEDGDIDGPNAGEGDSSQHGPRSVFSLFGQVKEMPAGRPGGTPTAAPDAPGAGASGGSSRPVQRPRLDSAMHASQLKHQVQQQVQQQPAALQQQRIGLFMPPLSQLQGSQRFPQQHIPQAQCATPQQLPLPQGGPPNAGTSRAATMLTANAGAASAAATQRPTQAAPPAAPSNAATTSHAAAQGFPAPPPPPAAHSPALAPAANLTCVADLFDYSQVPMQHPSQRPSRPPQQSQQPPHGAACTPSWGVAAATAYGAGAGGPIAGSCTTAPFPRPGNIGGGPGRLLDRLVQQQQQGQPLLGSAQQQPLEEEELELWD